MTQHGPEVDAIRAANGEVVRRFIDAINDSWNVERMRELVTEDFVFTIPFAPDWFRVHHEGREEALAFLDRVRDLMDPENLHDLEIDTYASDPGEVVSHYRSATRMKGTNVPYCNEYIGRFTVRDGKIASFAEYLDPIRFVLAIGGTVSPPSGISTTGARDGG
jgi:hypothetical protein